jgi:NAD-dependent DNA ligase
LTTSSTLYDAGFDTVAKILRMRLDDYLALDGWQERKSKNTYQAIRQKCQAADVIKVMAGSGIFGALIGTRKLEALRKARPKLFAFDHAYTERELWKMLDGVPGFKEKSAAPIVKNLERFSKWVSRLPIKFAAPKVVKVAGSKMAGQAVCFTGVRSKEAEEAIVAQGGSIASGVNSKTTILVAKDPTSTSGKMGKAQELGIKIMTISQLNKLLGI